MKPTIDELLNRGVVEIIERDHLAKRLQSGDTLRVKLGVDPTAPDLHLGHTVPLRKLRQFQDAGHRAVIIIGDWTARIGDPSGRDKTRPTLTAAQVKTNAKLYEKQILKLLRPDRAEIHYQSQWFDTFSLADLLKLAGSVSTWHLLSHETFNARKAKGQQLMHHETLYPLLQGYDSYAVKADVELGAVEQEFNLLTGRLVQKAYGQPPQDVVTMPYLLGTDGKEKMSKSLGNTINLGDSPTELYGKVMSIPDSLIEPYFELVTDLEFAALAQVKKELKTNPRDAKAHVAHLVVTELHGQPAAEEAKQEFDRVFRSKEKPRDIPKIEVKKSSFSLAELVVAAGLAPSRSQAVRLIEQGGVRVDDTKVRDPKMDVIIAAQDGVMLQVGKRRFAHVTTKVQSGS